MLQTMLEAVRKVTMLSVRNAAQAFAMDVSLLFVESESACQLMIVERRQNLWFCVGIPDKALLSFYAVECQTIP